MARKRTYPDDYWRLLGRGFDPFADAPSRPRAMDYRETPYKRSDFNDAFLNKLRTDPYVLAAKAERDAAIASGRRGRPAGISDDSEVISPEAQRARRIILERDIEYGGALRKVDNAPDTVKPYLRVYRDAGTLSPVLRLSGAGKGWRASPDTPMRVLAERVRDHKAGQLAREERSAREKPSARGRRNAEQRAVLLRAEVSALNRSIGQMKSE